MKQYINLDHRTAELLILALEPACNRLYLDFEGQIVGSIARTLDHRLAKMSARPYEGTKRLSLHEHEALTLQYVVQLYADWLPDTPEARQLMRQVITAIDRILKGSTDG